MRQPSFAISILSRLIVSCTCWTPKSPLLSLQASVSTTSSFLVVPPPMPRTRRQRATNILASDLTGSPTSVASINSIRSRTSLSLAASEKDNERATVPKKRGRPRKTVTTATDSANVPATPAKAKKKKKVKKSPEPGTVKPPAGWEDIYSLVEELRVDRSAPVDDNGSEALPQRDLGDRVFRFQVLIALMLSSQTKDAVVGETMRSLQEYGLTVESIAKTPAEQLNKLIGKVGFHNNKTKYIKKTVEILLKEYDGDIPESPHDMMKLPGVGPKMAFIIENVAWSKCSGIGIDTHMHRMFNELRWTSSKNPEQTRIQLEAWLPREKWDSVNLLWVGFGQEVQQFKPKLLNKALTCSRPKEALKLIRKLGLDYEKEGAKLGLEEKIKEVLKDDGRKPAQNDP